MTIHIPEWLLWVLGIFVGLPSIVFLAAMAWFGWTIFKDL